MKRITSTLVASLALLAGVFSTSCTNDFESTNHDPNRLQEISPATLLNPMIYTVASNNMYRSWQHTSLLMQNTINFPANPTATSIQHYHLSDNIGSAAWNTYYKYLKNAQLMEQSAIEVNEVNYQAIAITLKVWMSASLVDIFGDIPYFEASKGDQGILYPVFDDQKDVYMDLLALLEQANSLYDHTRANVYYPDILFENDSKKWQKFTNSLHLRLLLRTTNKMPENYQKMVSMISNPEKYPIINSIAEEATLFMTGISPNVSPWSRVQDFYNGRKMGAFFIDNLNDMNDPRRAFFSGTASKIIDGERVDIGYKGIPSAYDGPDSQFDYEASNLNRIIAEPSTKTAILTYSEVLFIHVELAQKGYLQGAEEYYNKAINASMDYYDLEIDADYFNNPLVKYDGTLEQIMLQKYYALYMNDYQQWLEYKRTGLPKLPVTKAMGNGQNLPSRFPYPLDVRTKNKTNYEKVIQKMGSDNINYKSWWQN